MHGAVFAWAVLNADLIHSATSLHTVRSGVPVGGVCNDFAGHDGLGLHRLERRVAPSVLCSLSLLSDSGASTMPAMSGESHQPPRSRRRLPLTVQAPLHPRVQPALLHNSQKSPASARRGQKVAASCTPLTEYVPVLQVMAGAQSHTCYCRLADNRVAVHIIETLLHRT